MSEAREGTPGEIAAMFGAVRDSQQQEPTDHPPTESEAEEPKAGPVATDAPADAGDATDADQAEAARLLGLHPDLAPRLTGDTVQELVSDAAELASTLDEARRRREAEQAPHVSFDGGVRESTPGPSDPESEHNQFLLDIFQQKGQGDGSGW